MSAERAGSVGNTIPSSSSRHTSNKIFPFFFLEKVKVAVAELPSINIFSLDEYFPKSQTSRLGVKNYSWQLCGSHTLAELKVNT